MYGYADEARVRYFRNGATQLRHQCRTRWDTRAGTEEELLRELLAEYQQAGSASNEVLLERLVLLPSQRRTYNRKPLPPMPAPST